MLPSKMTSGSATHDSLLIREDARHCANLTRGSPISRIFRGNQLGPPIRRAEFDRFSYAVFSRASSRIRTDWNLSTVMIVTRPNAIEMR